jgi:hypothetical protein
MLAFRVPVFLVAATSLLLLVATPAGACNIPVFRYAVDHWPSDPYRLTVFHRGPLDAQHRDLIQILEKAGAGDTPNVVLELIDLEKNPDGVEDLPLPPAGAELPFLVARYPAPTRIEAPIWAGTLRAEVVTALLDSPARREYARRARAGDSAVWVLLASGDAAKDDAAEKVLQTEVKRLAKELTLPELTDAPEDQLVGGAERPLRLAFSVLRVGRSDPAEAMFVKMLINTESDLPGRSDPMVFPLFGRGRTMPALIGAGITPENIKDAAEFLAGPCSCVVKRDNPGVDLLVVSDWTPAAAAESAPPFRTAPGTKVPIPSPVQATAAKPLAEEPRAAEPPPPPPASSSLPVSPRHLVLAGIGAAGLLVAVTGLMVLRSRRRVPH